MSGRSVALHMVNLSLSGLDNMVPHAQDQESSPVGICFVPGPQAISEVCQGPARQPFHLLGARQHFLLHVHAFYSL